MPLFAYNPHFDSSTRVARNLWKDNCPQITHVRGVTQAVDNQRHDNFSPHFRVENAAKMPDFCPYFSKYPWEFWSESHRVMGKN